MPKRGWIKTWRSLRDSEIWKDRPFSKGQAWIDLLLRAKFGEEGGHIITSIRVLSEDWGWSVKKTWKFLNHLENELMVGKQFLPQKRKQKGTRLTILNWETYQGTGNEKETERETEKQHPIRSKEVKEEKNINNAITKISVYDKIQDAFKREFPDEKEIPDKGRIRYWFSQGNKRHDNRFTTQELLKRIYRARPLAREMDLKIGSPIGFITAGIKGDRNGVAYLDRQTKEEKRKGSGVWKLNDILKGVN